ncbi:phage tail family protein [Psychrobacillus sp. Sa2BUA9]|uniref:Phage tail family protein n=1 Tax=Psychrobacillus faecigallinarum TaxID=2762235 RepID=A0ABR8RFS7_9BACI|nr:distal tail protein Dit [Psychrobacillus faecigallinarum]MBD7946402.1 phage tail family protein [Psychrobacillus faecigallinarum]
MGLTFNGKHCNTVGLDVSDTRRPLMAEPDITFVEVPGRNGAIVITNTDKPTFKDINVEVDFLLEPNGQSFHNHCRQIAKWLSTLEKKPLVFDDDPSYTYKAIVTSQIDIERISGYGEFTVIFRCDPYEVTS